MRKAEWKGSEFQPVQNFLVASVPYGTKSSTKAHLGSCSASSATAPDLTLQTKHDITICNSQNIPGSSRLYMRSSGEKMVPQICLHTKYQEAFRDLEQMLGRDHGEQIEGGRWDKGREGQGKDNMAQINGI